MKTSEVLKIETFLLDENLNILSSTVRGVKGGNFYEIIQYQKIAIRRYMEDLNNLQSLNIDTFLRLKEGYDRKPYTLIVYRSLEGYFITAIAQDEINMLIDTAQTLEEHAYLDQLTGAYNRHAYWKILETMLYELDRLGIGLGVLFIDIDNLKQINTEGGYMEGDSTIAFVAKCANHCLRKYDILVRLGGDEFLALFRVDPKKDFTVEDMGNRILNRVKRESGGSTTISLGGHYIKPGIVSQIAKSGRWKKQWEIIIKELDVKLRKSKKGGKAALTI